MDILVSPLPLFNNKMEVEAYFLDSQKGNKIIKSSMPAFKYDGAFHSSNLELVNHVTLEALTHNKPIFIEITDILLKLDLEAQTGEPAEKVVFVLDKNVKPDDETIKHIKRYKAFGFRFAIYEVSNYNFYEPLLEAVDFYIFKSLNKNTALHAKNIKQRFNVKAIVLNISSTIDFNNIVDKDIDLLNGNFYKLPVSKGVKNIEPLKLNYMKLIEMANSEEYEIDEFSKYISQDPALAFEFLRMVNSTKYEVLNEIKTIKHAANMLGGEEVKKWISTAVINIMSKDKPSEITRLSLLRGKFAENLASVFNLETDKESLFLMGLFSVLDVVLDTDIKSALDLIAAPVEIIDALANKKGPYYDAYKFIIDYELGDWQSISRTLILKDIKVPDIYDLYNDVIIWYSYLVNWEPEK